MLLGPGRFRVAGFLGPHTWLPPAAAPLGYGLLPLRGVVAGLQLGGNLPDAAIRVGVRGNRSGVRAEEPAETRTSAPDPVSQSNEKFRQRIGVGSESLVHRAEHLLGRDFDLKAAHGAQGRIIAQLPDQRRPRWARPRQDEPPAAERAQ